MGRWYSNTRHKQDWGVLYCSPNKVPPPSVLGDKVQGELTTSIIFYMMILYDSMRTESLITHQNSSHTVPCSPDGQHPKTWQVSHSDCSFILKSLWRWQQKGLLTGERQICTHKPEGWSGNCRLVAFLTSREKKKSI